MRISRKAAKSAKKYIKWIEIYKKSAGEAFRRTFINSKFRIALEMLSPYKSLCKYADFLSFLFQNRVWERE